MIDLIPYVVGLLVLAGIVAVIGFIEVYRGVSAPQDSLETLRREWDNHVSNEAKRVQEQAAERRKGGL